MSDMDKLILASKSPRRAELLKRLGIAFSVCAPEVDERVSGEPAACVEELARRKAGAGARMAGSGWVLAADTLVFLDGRALGKPKDAAQAGVKDGDIVSVKVENERGTVFSQVKIRVDESFTLEMHIDTDEANAAKIATGDTVRIIME